LVVIHGQVMHKSANNLSDKPRHAYTFHMVETKGSEYAANNWLQPTDAMPFPKLFAD
jgi:ectoine hydroxylase-related dioxygenase (phytanoyl-CoA dioxygenase family)